jgi:hypothetical protein
MKNEKAVSARSTWKMRLLGAAFVGLLILAACANPVAHNAATALAANKKTGHLTLSIPAIASWIKTSPSSGAQKGVASRAMGMVDSVKVQVQSGGVDVITPVVQWIGQSNTIGNSTTSVTVPLIPVGTNYTVILSVYNTSVSSTTPVVIGQATGVGIAQNATTNVTITCIPNNPATMPSVPTGETPTLASGAEQWYSMQVTGGIKYYFLQTDPDVQFAVFDKTGALISPGGYCAYVAAYTGTIYVGMVNYSGATANGALQVTYVAPTLNEGTSSSPAALALDQSHLFQMGPASGNEASSYYSFTTTSAGTYALDITDAGYNGVDFMATLYSNQGYSTTVAGPSYVWSAGMVFPGLSAFTTYYLELTNQSGSYSSFTGQLADPVYIAANSNNQGSVASPVSLQIGTSISAKVGSNVWDNTSYYSFTTGPDIDYIFTMTNMSTNLSVNFTLYSAAAFTQVVQGWNGTSFSMLPLSPNTTYYLEAMNNNIGTGSTFTLEIGTASTPTFTTLPTDGSWNPGSVSSGSNVWYMATVTAGQTYDLWWDNAYQGSGTYTNYCSVSAYQANRLNLYFSSSAGYTTPQVITVPAGQTQVYICVSGGGSTTGTTGTFALKMAAQ